MLTEYHTHEMATFTERHPSNALKFGTTGEVNSKEGRALVEGRFPILMVKIEVGTHQVELD